MIQNNDIDIKNNFEIDEILIKRGKHFSNKFMFNLIIF